MSVGSAMRAALLFPSSGGDNSNNIFTTLLCNATVGAIISGNVVFKPDFSFLIEESGNYIY